MLATNSTASEAGPGALGLHTILRGVLVSAALVFVIRALLVNGRNDRAGAGHQRTNLVLLAFYATIAAVSTFYSVDPLQTAGKAYEISIAVMLAWALATSPSAAQQLRAALDFIVVLWSARLLVAIPGYFILPSQFVSPDGRPGFVFSTTMASPYTHSNGLSASGAMLAAYAIARGINTPEIRARRLWYVLAATASVAVLLASGRQGVIIWAVGVGIVLFLYARPVFVYFLIPCLAFLLHQFGGVLWEAFTRQQQDATLYSLSGRTDFWLAAIDAWRDSPLLGYGFGSGGRLVALTNIGAGHISSLHSGYFEALVGVGLTGTIPLLIVVVRVVRWSFRSLRLGSDAHLAILIVPLVLHAGISLGFAAWLSSEFLALAFLGGLADLARRFPAPTGAYAGVSHESRAAPSPIVRQ